MPILSFFKRLHRKSFKKTVQALKELEVVAVSELIVLPKRLPQFDDVEPLGLSFFRTTLEDLDFSSLTMKRTFFSKTKIIGCDFTNTDLLESNLCWCNFKDTCFSGANLKWSDLRASKFTNVDFSGCDLSSTDLRRSSFKKCNFEGANLKGARINSLATPKLPLSAEQKAGVDWHVIDDLEPKGG